MLIIYINLIYAYKNKLQNCYLYDKNYMLKLHIVINNAKIVKNVENCNIKNE